MSDSGPISLSKTDRLLGLYQKPDRIDDNTGATFPDLVRIAYVGSQVSKRNFWFSNEDAVEKIERILLYVDAPMMLVSVIALCAHITKQYDGRLVFP